MMAKRKKAAEETEQTQPEGALKQVEDLATDGPNPPTAGPDLDEEDGSEDPPISKPAAIRALVPQDNGALESSDSQKALLLDACERFGIDPTIHDQEGDSPQELASWKWYPGQPAKRVPASVVVVTSGGVKLRHYERPDFMAALCTEFAMDQDTEERLARIFNAFKRDPKTKEIMRLPLPEDLALPVHAITGVSGTTEHIYRRGYLREGGKKEADKREAKAKAARRTKA